MTLIFASRCLRSVLDFLLCVCGSLAYGLEQPSSAQIAEWRKLAEEGNAEAQHNIGLCYANGHGVTKNEIEAVKWYRKAAEQGLAGAQYNLGCIYESGDGIEKDLVEAVKWYRKAADQGYASGQSNLGFCYLYGHGVTKDETEGIKWFRKAADQGLALAQSNLGFCYQYGHGVTKDETEAVKWYRKAADQGLALAQLNLGNCYHNGEGVVKNPIESYKWSLLAAAKGNETAKQNVSKDERLLTPAQRAEGQRLAQEWEAAFAARQAGPDSERGSTTHPKAGNTPKITGTGFLITRNGYLVTNYHVLKGCGKVRVQTSAGLLDAAIIRVDATSDLALLKVSGTFDALSVVSSRTARLGAMVATVGFPNIGLQGFEPKLSKGDISSLAGIQDDVRYFQISVPVQPGNSGGPLFDERGNVVGVVTAQLSQEAALIQTGTLAQNVNYAVKSSYLLSFLEAIPEASVGMLDAKNEVQKFESLVDDVKKATVLIIGY